MKKSHTVSTSSTAPEVGLEIDLDYVVTAAITSLHKLNSRRHLRPMNATEQPVVMVEMLLLLWLLFSRLLLLLSMTVVVQQLCSTRRRSTTITTTLPLLTRTQRIMIRMGLSMESQSKHLVSRT